MKSVGYPCNNPDIVNITNNDNYNIFIDTKMNIVYLKGFDKNHKTKQIKLGNCNELFIKSQDECCNCVAIPPPQNISCEELFKYTGFYVNYDQLIDQTKNTKINNLSIALVNSDDKKVRLYMYYSSIKKWNIIGVLLDLSNIICNSSSSSLISDTCKSLTTPICSYQSLSIESDNKVKQYEQINYILLKNL